MKRRSVAFLKACIGVGLLGCCGVAPKAPEAPPPAPIAALDAGLPVAAAVEEKPPLTIDPPIWMSVAEVETACKHAIEKASRLRDQVGAPDTPRTKDATLAPVNEMLIELYGVLAMSELHANVHPQKELRDAAEICQQDAAKLLTAITLDRRVYDALVAVDETGLDPVTTRFLVHLLRDYKLSGVDKDEETRKRLADLQEAMVKAGQDFSRTIREDKRFIEVDKSATAGLPEDFVAAHKTDTGKYRFTTDSPDFMPVVSYAEKERTRKALYLKFLERAYPANETNLKQLLYLRHQYAGILGYPDWAEYNAQDKMIGSEANIAAFIDKVADIARPRMKREVRTLLARKKRDVGSATAVREWDRFYYLNVVRAEQYGVDAKALREYFEVGRVMAGILAVNEQLFGVTFEKVDAPVWHEDVAAYNVKEGGEVIGRFYLDMYPREGKYAHAAEFGMLTGIPGRQISSAGLVCNFPKPGGDTPALMEHDQVITLFHEFGHLMHQILAGHHPWVTLSGIACEDDFVEAPSQLLEHWGWRYEVLKRFALHARTGEPIPEALVEKMNAADKFGRGTDVMRQMFYAGLSYTYHARNPEGVDLLAVVKEMQKKYSPFPYEKGTYVYAGFGHLEGYSSLYYTYMWSLALSEDMFGRFDKEGLMNPETASDYRKAVLDPGGTVDAAEMVARFLGREQSFDALERYLKD